MSLILVHGGPFWEQDCNFSAYLPKVMRINKSIFCGIPTVLCSVSRWFDQLHVLKNTTKIPLGEILVMDASCFLTEICLELKSFIWQFVSYLIKDFRVQTSRRSDVNLPHICLWKKVIFVSLFGFVTCEDTKIENLKIICIYTSNKLTTLL